MNPFIIFPSQWRTEAFSNVIRKMDFIKLYINTLLMIFGRIVCAVVTATTAGYAFGRLKFKGRDLCFSLVLFQMMVPVQIFIIPQYLMVSKLGMLNTIFSLIFPGLVTAFGTFLMRQAFMGLPKDLEEAARLDGCNIGQTFLYVMMPLTKSSMVALGIFTALFGYKDLMWPTGCKYKSIVHTACISTCKITGTVFIKLSGTDGWFVDRMYSDVGIISVIPRNSLLRELQLQAVNYRDLPL